MRDAEAHGANVDCAADLERLANSGVVSVRLARRARIVLLAMRGCGCATIARTLGIGRAQVARWLRRYEDGGLAAIASDRQRSGRRRRVNVEAIVGRAMQPAPDGAKWSTRKLAAVCGVSDSTVWRAWRDRRDMAPGRRAAGAAPPPNELVVGVYLAANERAIASCSATLNARTTSSRMMPDVLGNAATPPKVARVRERPDKDITLVDVELRSRGGTTSELAWIDFLERIVSACGGQRIVVDCDSARLLGRPVVKAWLAKHTNIAVQVAASALAWRRRVDRLLHGGHEGDRDAVPLYCHLMDTLVGYFAASRCSTVPFVWTWRSRHLEPLLSTPAERQGVAAARASMAKLRPTGRGSRSGDGDGGARRGNEAR